MLILAAGPFGHAVARRLATARDRATIVDLTAPIDEIAALIPQHDFVAVASWRPYVETCRRIDDLCHQHYRPWSIVEISGSTLTCGPSVVPGTGRGCYHCYVARLDVQKRDGDWSRVLRQAYAVDPSLGPVGHTPAMVEIAVAALAQDAGEPEAAGRFRRIDVLTGTVLETELIPLHDCARCRPQPETYEPTGRFLHAMVPELERLLS